ncbi:MULTISPECIES: lysylphosphatidylglycerol synthase transmembrane domain-containing protein [Thermodesulfovibrio]|uniref:Lysylphosphatidylglycerol synthase transmembrane domain-containing protein n=1 Tax=Thermodesulfovibrio obliviosus TaxID=3118332 RepID=A0AAU8H2D6_9BACT
MKKYIKFFIRFAVTVLLILYLFKKIDITHVLNTLFLINPLIFLSASFLYILSSYISTLRWKIFLPQQHLKVSELFSLYLIGSFFNNVLPGIIGGDLIKIFMIKEKAGLKKALASVFMERYTGLFALLLIGFAFFCLFYKNLPQHRLMWSVPLSFLSFILASLFLLLLGKIKFFKEFHDYVLSFTRKQILQAIFYSFLVQFTIIVSVYVIFLGIDISVSFIEVCIFLPIIILISMLPISVSGIGVREWCFIIFFGKSFGKAQVVAVSLLWFMSQVFASLVGGVEYLKFKKTLDIKKK